MCKEGERLPAAFKIRSVCGPRTPAHVQASIVSRKRRAVVVVLPHRQLR